MNSIDKHTIQENQKENMSNKNVSVCMVYKYKVGPTPLESGFASLPVTLCCYRSSTNSILKEKMQIFHWSEILDRFVSTIINIQKLFWMSPVLALGEPMAGCRLSWCGNMHTTVARGYLIINPTSQMNSYCAFYILQINYISIQKKSVEMINPLTRV